MTDPWTSPNGAAPASPPAAAPSPYAGAGPAHAPRGAGDPYAMPGAAHAPQTAPWATMTKEQQRAADRLRRRAVTDARLPREPAEYQHVLRGPAHRWWKPLLSIPLLVIVYLALTAFAGIIGALAFVASGARVEMDALTSMDMNSPGIFVLGMVSLAILIPVSLVVIRVVHGVRAGYLHSVAGRFRWGWAARLTLVLLPLFAVYVALHAVLTGWSWQPRANWVLMLVLVLVLVPFQAAGEEYAFRGVLMQAVGAWIPHRWLALVVPGVLSAVIFALLHGSFDPIVLLNLGLFAALAVWATWRTGGLEAAVVIHALNNVLLLLVDVGRGDMNTNLVSEETTSTLIDLAPTAVFFVILAVAVHLLARRADVQRRTEPPVVPAGWEPAARPPLPVTHPGTPAAPAPAGWAGPQAQAPVQTPPGDLPGQAR